jgi:hypothetical protein
LGRQQTADDRVAIIPLNVSCFRRLASGARGDSDDGKVGLGPRGTRVASKVQRVDERLRRASPCRFEGRQGTESGNSWAQGICAKPTSTPDMPDLSSESGQHRVPPEDRTLLFPTKGGGCRFRTVRRAGHRPTSRDVPDLPSACVGNEHDAASLARACPESVSVRPSHLADRSDSIHWLVFGVQRWGSSSSIRLAGCVGSRSSTSLR